MIFNKNHNYLLKYEHFAFCRWSSSQQGKTTTLDGKQSVHTLSTGSGILCQPFVADGVEGEHTSGTVGTGRLSQGKYIYF